MWLGSRLARLGLGVLALLAECPVIAQELLSNRSFETPVAPLNGNNFYTTIPNWTVINVAPAQVQPFNVIKPWAGYASNPTSTPTGGGAQYFDVNSAAGTLRQTVTVSAPGMVDFSGWFSVRDSQQALTGLTINVRDSGGALLGTGTTSFTASDPIGLWKQVSGVNVPVSPGTYIFEVVIPDPANFDLASLVFKPTLTLSKSSSPVSDASNGTTNPKLIPGGIVEYLITASSPAAYSVTSNSLVLTDSTPTNTELVVSDIGSAGSGPLSFSPGASGLTYTFATLGSAADNIDFSNNNGATWTYAPTANGNGTDPNVTTIRVRPQGTMAAGSTIGLRVRYRIK